ncbi:MAG: hypothetical protein U1D96_09900 [Eubacteriales bacterium]|jgi:spore germination protein KC|nr:hypothetical protein [Bacillota bacterium]MBV1727014.1 hypothetical protein [Desulforudis sp.]MDP3050780.1 hypothetical protein [Eubacteriales bacterium]MDQ7789863.1 hypothetical protein [Clostridia bacterium]MBU4534058.1 hypothetical protein [Bacillota bacterium]
MYHKRCLMAAAVLLTIVFMTAGCWDRDEVEELGIVLGIAIKSLPGERVQMIAQFANPRLVGGAQVGRETPGASISSK